MKNKSIFPGSEQLGRFKVAKNIKKSKQSNLTPAIILLAAIVSGVYLKKAGYN